jgi:formate hydrogenlyase transcriptional activator
LQLNSVLPAQADTSTEARYQALFRVAKTISAHRDPEKIFRALASELRSVVEFDAIYCVQCDDAGKVAWRVTESAEGACLPPPPDDSLMTWIYEAQRPLVIPCVQSEIRFPCMMEFLTHKGCHSLCGFPLTTAHRRLGSFGIASHRPRAYSQEEVGFLSLIADQIALAIDNACNFEALQHEKDRLKLLLDINNSVVSNLEISELLRSISSTLRIVMQCDGAGIALHCSDDDQLHLCAFDAPAYDGEIKEGAVLTVDSAVRAFRLREPVVLNRGENPDDFATKDDLDALCHLPLVSRDRVLGVLGVGRRDKVFTSEDVAFLNQVAGQVAIAIENALAYGQIADLKNKLALENVYLEDEIRSEMNFEEIIGTSSKLRSVLQEVETVAPTGSTVLIHGETGTGKELIARAIHDLSTRAKGVFVKLNCAAIPTGLLESELFGHEKGAFTGAVAQRIGRFELANNGTVFLDEIGEIPLELQPKLLRVLQEREFERLGSSRTLKTNARLIAATNRDLGAMVAEGKFRADLYYRLNVFPILVPPLRSRKEDIPLLVRHFVQQLAREMNKTIDTIPSETMSLLVGYHWPGNIRELQNLIERAVILSTGPVLRVPMGDLQVAPRTVTSNAVETLDEGQRRHILEALNATDWVVSGPRGAAAMLGIKRSTLQMRMQKLGIRRARSAAS